MCRGDRTHSKYTTARMTHCAPLAFSTACGGRAPWLRAATRTHNSSSFSSRGSIYTRTHPPPPHCRQRAKTTTVVARAASGDGVVDDDGILGVYAGAAAARRPDGDDGGGEGDGLVRVGGGGCSLGLEAEWSLTFDGRGGMGFYDEVMLDSGEASAGGGEDP